MAEELIDYIPFAGAIHNFFFPDAPADGSAEPSFQDRMASVAQNDAMTKGIASGVEAAVQAPVVGGVIQFGLDAANRTMDSIFGSAAYTGSQIAEGEFEAGTIVDGWLKSWQSWGTPEHVTAGQILGASLTDPFGENINPFDQRGAQAIRDMSKKTWYGNVAGGIFDLTAGFVGPGTVAGAAVRSARASGALRTSTHVSETARVWSEASDAGRLDDLNPERGRSFFRQMGGLEQSPESHAARLRDLARDARNHSGSQSEALDWAAPRMEGATEQAKRVVAETMAMTRDLPEPLAVETIGNVWLAAMGSERAASKLHQTAPLVLDALANSLTPPSLFGDVAKAQEKMFAAFRAGEEINLAKIVDETFDTPQKQATAAALREARDRATEQALKAKEFRQRLTAMKPQFRTKVDGRYVDNFDTARLKESRLNAANQFRMVSEELKAAKAELRKKQGEAKGLAQMSDAQQKGLTSKQVLQDGADALKSKEGRDALAAFGPYKQAEYYAKESGAGTARVSAAEARIAELEQRLAQAKADNDLLQSTPLNDPDAMVAWKADLTNARAGVKASTQRRDLLAAMERIQRQQLKDDAAAARQLMPTLNATHQWLADIENLGKTGDAYVGRVTPTLLDRAKTKFRDRVGRTYMFTTGDLNRRQFFHDLPNETLANIGTPYGRNAVNTHDLYKGKQELGMYLRKSEVFQGEEIRAAVEEFVAAGTPSKSAAVAQKYNDLMRRRMAEARGLELDDIEALLATTNRGLQGIREYHVGRLVKTPEGDKWVRTNEFPWDDAADADHFLPEPVLRSHVADTVPFMDPIVMRGLLDKLEGKSVKTFLRSAEGQADFLNYLWKNAALIRPGLFFRNMLDTGLRADLIMGHMALAAATLTGTMNVARNLGIRAGDWAVANNTFRGTALQRIGFRQGSGTVATHRISDPGITVKGPQGEDITGRLYDLNEDGTRSAASHAAIMGAATRGQHYSEGLLGSATPLAKEIYKNHGQWDKFKANDIRWAEGYRDHANVMLASPTVQRLSTLDDLAEGPDDLVRYLFEDPKVRDEFNQLARTQGHTREAFVEHVVQQYEVMFPEPGMAKIVASGKLKGKAGDRWIEENFPRELRFDVPAHGSVLRDPLKEGKGDWWKQRIEDFYRLALDIPDRELIRHPVMNDAYKKQFKLEVETLKAARVKKYGDKAEITKADIAKIDARARTHAVGTVKKYMYDGTYSTNFQQRLRFMAPFFTPWYDSMRAFSKLIYDDPQRLQTMLGFWNAPMNLSPWLPEPLVVDVNGQPLAHGQESQSGDDEKYLVLSSLIGGKTPFGSDLKFRMSSFNTILVGDTPWLPGWGPVVTVPVAAALNTNEDVALWLSNSKNPIIETGMKSLFMGGDVPRADGEDIIQMITPPTWKKMYNAIDGEQKFRTAQYGYNQRYIDALNQGVNFDPKKAWDEAEREATNAGIISLISQGVFGISAKGDVAGSYYADEMHAIQAIPIETVRKGIPNAPNPVMRKPHPTHQALFAEMFPEAANLTWTFTRNETGINATVKAQSRALKLRDQIEEFPDFGWLIVGEENLDGEFSSTAYNQQRTDPYGPTRKGRKVLDKGEAAEQAMAGAGWDRYTRMKLTVDQMAAQEAWSPQVLAVVKRKMVEQIAAENPVWFADYNQRVEKLPVFFNAADKIAADPRNKNRQDLGMYVEYRAVRDEVMALYGLRSLGGTGEKSALARRVLNKIGTQMAAQSLGFQQMWDRMLENETEELVTDARFVNG